tara:strand:- start:177 stop:335 length:159 start_codon:yes stop_codon:yes gene_type:complete
MAEEKEKVVCVELFFDEKCSQGETQCHARKKLPELWSLRVSRSKFQNDGCLS